jgi:hypothetical protein
VALARGVYLEALGNKPVAFFPDGRREWPFHTMILAHAGPIFGIGYWPALRER